MYWWLKLMDFQLKHYIFDLFWLKLTYFLFKCLNRVNFNQKLSKMVGLINFWSNLTLSLGFWDFGCCFKSILSWPFRFRWPILKPDFSIESQFNQDLVQNFSPSQSNRLSLTKCWWLKLDSFIYDVDIYAFSRGRLV